MVLRSGVRGAGLALRSWAVTFFFISTVYGASSTFADVWVDDDWSNQVAGAVVDGHTFGTDAFATIQAGIDAVETGGVVWVAAGAYSAGADVGSKPLALRALAGAGQTIINGSIGAELITSGELVVDGFTIHGTRAVSATDSSVAVSNCVLKADNTSGVYGWGVYLVRSSAKIVRNVIGDVQPSVTRFIRARFCFGRQRIKLAPPWRAKSRITKSGARSVFSSSIRLPTARSASAIILLPEPFWLVLCGRRVLR